MSKQATKVLPKKKSVKTFQSIVESYIIKKQKFLETQVQLHISKRENTPNTVYLNAQRDLLIQMKEDLKL